ncbi:Uncharacterised protein [Acinetobacter baumannii]|nr:Uncharacterised protein [Acinetobacter baumannii]
MPALLLIASLPTVEPRSVFWILISDLLFSIETVCPFKTLFTVLNRPVFPVTTTSLLAFKFIPLLLETNISP